MRVIVCDVIDCEAHHPDTGDLAAGWFSLIHRPAGADATPSVYHACSANHAHSIIDELAERHGVWDVVAPIAY